MAMALNILFGIYSHKSLFFNKKFHFISREVAKAADIKLHEVVSSLEHLSTMSPLVAMRQGDTLPFVTSREWVEHATKLQEETPSLMNVFYTPWLQGAKELEAWEGYAMSYVYTNSGVWAFDETTNGTKSVLPLDGAVYSPMWQVYPQDTAAIQLDLNTIKEFSFLTAASLYPTVSAMVGMSDNSENITTVWDYFDFGDNHNGTVVDPHSFFFHPILDTDNATTVVAHIGGILTWESFFDNVSLQQLLLQILNLFCDPSLNFCFFALLNACSSFHQAL